MKSTQCTLCRRGGLWPAKSLAALLCLGAGLSAHADVTPASYSGQISSSISGGQGSSGSMWGTGSGGGIGVAGSVESASQHMSNSASAGYAEAARKGFPLMPGSSYSVQAIGSQSIVSNSVYGNNNSNNLDIRQDSENSGSVDNSGGITNPGPLPAVK